MLVKTIGDAAMFVSPEVEPLIETVVTVARDVEAEGGDFPSVRIGVAYGPATNRGGDWFLRARTGACVSLARPVLSPLPTPPLYARLLARQDPSIRQDPRLR